MAETFVNVTEGSGKKLHGWDLVAGGNTVVDEFVIPGEYPYPTFTADAQTVSGATTGDDLLQVMAGASLKLRIRRVTVNVRVAITTAAEFSVDIVKLTSAGTGGTAVTPRAHDPADSAGATAASGVPNATHGTASFVWRSLRLWPVQTAPAAGIGGGLVAEWVQSPFGKPFVIPAGTTNGIAIRVQTGRAGVSLEPTIEFVETSF